MKKTEKRLIIGFVSALIILIFSATFIARNIVENIDNFGGVRNIVIDAGKGIKSVIREINEE